MNHDFESSLAFVLAAEGGFANVAADKGGATQSGITQGTYSEWLKGRGLPDGSVATATPEFIESIYHQLFWNGGGCDRLESPLNLIHFDARVNHGGSAATSMLLAATWAPGQGVDVESFAYLALRWSFYQRLVARDPSQGKFLTGWKNRLFHLLRTAGLATDAAPTAAV